jgi:hypothetical protein
VKSGIEKALIISKQETGREGSHQRQILNEGKEFSMTEFRNRWLGVSTERVYMLMEIFEDVFRETMP